MATYFKMPINNTYPWQRFLTTLSGVIYTLRFRYNLRMDRWMMDIADSTNEVIIAGMTVLITQNLFGQYVVVELPPGMFFCTDDTNQGTEPSRNSFETTHTVFYEDPS